MIREAKVQKRKERAYRRAVKNRERNAKRWERNGRSGYNDCPYDVEINSMYGTCNCGGVNAYDCAMDI